MTHLAQQVIVSLLLLGFFAFGCGAGLKVFEHDGDPILVRRRAFLCSATLTGLFILMLWVTGFWVW